MDENLDDALVSGYEHIVGQLSLPDRNDCHVLAAAIHGGASIIVTVNLRDFPANVIETHGIEAQHPDTPRLRMFRTSRLPSNTRTMVIGLAAGS